MQRDELAREVRRNSLTLGQGAEDTSRMMGAGFDQPTLSRFQRSMSEEAATQMAAYGTLRLNPNKLAAEPMIKALGEVAMPVIIMLSRCSAWCHNHSQASLVFPDFSR